LDAAKLCRWTWRWPIPRREAWRPCPTMARTAHTPALQSKLRPDERVRIADMEYVSAPGMPPIRCDYGIAMH